jgi:hypothetical protein
MNDPIHPTVARRRAMGLGLGCAVAWLGGCGDPEAGSMPAMKKSKKDTLGTDAGQLDPAAKPKGGGARKPR